MPKVSLREGSLRRVAMIHYPKDHAIMLREEIDYLDAHPSREIPPVSGGRIVGELFAGAGAAVVGAILGAGTAVAASGESGWDRLDYALAGGVVGVALAPPVGVYLVGTAGDETGSFAATFAGSLVGGGLGFLMAVAIGGNDDSYLVSLIACPAIGATIAFNLTRKVEEPETPTSAVLSSVNGNLKLGIPSLRIQPHPIDRSPMQTVDLLRVQF
jgi:hypothetical protein